MNIQNNQNKFSNVLNEKSYLNITKLPNKDATIIDNKKSIKSLLIIIIILFIVFCNLLILYIISLKKDIQNLLHHTTNNSTNKMKNLNNINSIMLIEPYLNAQKDFCENQNKYINKKYEDELFLYNVKLNELSFQMYVYNTTNFLLNELHKFGAYEVKVSNYIIEALKFYKMKYNIFNNKDIFILDVGGNIGWYPMLLAQYGYSIMTFEAFEKNYYVEKKNFCLLNKDSNLIIITKGVGDKEKICYYFNQKLNTGNGMVVCDNKDMLNNTKLGKLFIKESKVEITTLNYFFSYLKDKKIAVMKIDVEGNELQVLEGGLELISIYHVPYIVLEFSPSYLKESGSDYKKLPQLLVDNGYKISIDGFLSKKYLSVDELIAKAGFQINCYFIHESMT